MNFFNFISLSALVISIISITISWHFGFRDRAHLKTIAKFYPAYPGHSISAHINIKIVNYGRRPTILSSFGGDHKGGDWSSTSLGKEGKGIRLQEHEKYETDVYSQDLISIDINGDVQEFANFWFEDTLGQRHKVKKSQQLIKKLKGNKNENH